jgi:META domain
LISTRTTVGVLLSTSAHADSGRDPFERNRRVRARCNSAQDRFRFHLRRLVFNPRELMSTMVECPGRPGHEDDWLSEFFEAGPRWRTDGGRLILTAPRGTLVLRPR